VAQDTHINLQEVTYVSRRHRLGSSSSRFRGTVQGSQVLKIYARMFRQNSVRKAASYISYAFSLSNRIKMHLTSSAFTSFAARPKFISHDKNFEVKHPRRFNPVTNMADEQSKHNYIALLGTVHTGRGPQPNCCQVTLL
jgi:hypothetical protein